MDPQPAISIVSHPIQLSVAPVFLLAGIGVMTNRLGRIVDRARVVEARILREDDHQDDWAAEMLRLEQRTRSINTVIGFCTLTLLLVCVVIALIFLGALLAIDTADAVAVVFIAAMVCFMTGLLLLLREVLVATRKLHFGSRQG